MRLSGREAYNMRGGVSTNVKKLTVGALLSAMSVALISFGALLETLDLSMAAIASFACVFAVIELKGMYPWLMYAVTGIISVLLMPQSMAGWFYLLFFGYYPMLKEKFERLKKPVAWVLKLILLNAAILICAVIVYFFFMGSGEGLLEAFEYVFGNVGGVAVVAVLYLLVNVVFVVYDIALTRLISFYIFKLSKRFKFLNR